VKAATAPPAALGPQWDGGGDLRSQVLVGGALVLSQLGFYVAIYVFLRTHLGIWRYMLYALPVFAFGVWAPLWAMRFALQQHWPLLPVQLGMFAAAVLSSLLGLIVIEHQNPTATGWIGLLLVVAGTVVSSIK
jgi:hypothetical protein